AQPRERTARRWTPGDRGDLEIGRIRATDDLPQELEILNGTTEGPRLHHVHQEPPRPLGKRKAPEARDRLVSRLQAEDAAEVRGAPRGASPIRAQFQRRHACRDRRRAAAGAATRRTLEPVRVFALRIDVALHLIALEVGWYVRIAKKDCASGLDPLD